MNKVLFDALETETVFTDQGDPRTLHSSITADEGHFLQTLIYQYRPTYSLEVGCAYGISSLFICEALSEVEGKQHIVIDPHQSASWEGIGLLNLQRAGFGDLVTLHEEASHTCLPRLETEGQRIDFAFIDGMHTFDYVLVDFFHIDKMLNVGGLIVFDDLGYPSIRKVCRYILSNLSYIAAGPPARMTLRDWIQLPFRRYQKPEFKRPDAVLGIGPTRYLAIKKTADDKIGDGPSFTRHWAAHNEF